METILKEYSFSSLLSDLVGIIRAKIGDSSLRFVTKIDCSIPNALLGDEVRIRQILLNVMGNAVKYTNEGFISLSVIGSMVDADNILLTIDVTDSGKGIKEEDMEKLFGDTGLGLAITKNLLKAMDGNIDVKSEHGKGSEFTITIPQKICSPEPLASVKNPGEKSVLVYERRELYINSILYAINGLGVFCQCVNSDEELLEKLKAGNYAFIFVPYVFAKNVRKILQELKSDIKVVVLVGNQSSFIERNISSIIMPVNSMSIADILNKGEE
jgi:hypothetical protein